MSNHTVLVNRDGKWWEIISKAQCGEQVCFYAACQGVKGHKGVHWCYDLSGYYCYHDNKDDSTEEGGCGKTPPSHKDYVSPEIMAPYFYRNIGKEFVEIIDVVQLNRLNAGLFYDNEIVSRPLK